MHLANTRSPSSPAPPKVSKHFSSARLTLVVARFSLISWCTQKTASHGGVTIAPSPPQFAEQPSNALPMRQRPKWRAAADEDGHYCFAVTL